jgi:hypothetical protein
MLFFRNQTIPFFFSMVFARLKDRIKKRGACPLFLFVFCHCQKGMKKIEKKYEERDLFVYKIV